MADDQTAQEKDRALTEEVSLMKERNKTLAQIVNVEKDISIKSKEIQTVAGQLHQQYESTVDSVYSGLESFTTGMFGGPMGTLINTLTVGVFKRRHENKKSEKAAEELRVKKRAEENELHEKSLSATAKILQGTDEFKNKSEKSLVVMLKKQEEEKRIAEANEAIKGQKEKALEFLDTEENLHKKALSARAKILQGTKEFHGLNEDVIIEQIKARELAIKKNELDEKIKEEKEKELAFFKDKAAANGGEVDTGGAKVDKGDVKDKSDKGEVVSPAPIVSSAVERPGGTGFLMSAEEKVDKSHAAKENGGEKVDSAKDKGGIEDGVLGENISKIEDHTDKTLQAIAGTAETRREEEREEDREHKELIDTLKGISGVEKKDSKDEEGGFGLFGALSSIVGGVALGLATEGIMFKFKTLGKAVENFKTKWLGFGDDTAKTLSKTGKVIDNAKDAAKATKLADAAGDAGKVTSKLKGWKAGFRQFFDIPAKQVDTAKDALKVASKGVDAAGDAGKVTSKLKNFLGPGIAGIFNSVSGKVDDIAKGAKVATAESGMLGGLGKMFGKTALKLTAGVAGRALSVAGNPVFDIIATGKDVFDIAHAVTDDDVATAVKKEDVGAVIGSIVGGALGFALGGPAGAALGIGLGNMAGEFIGAAMDDPEILGAIENVRAGLKSEQATLKTEIADIEAQINDTTGAVSEDMKALLRERKLQIEGRQTDITAELANMEALKADEEALKAIQKKGFDLAAKKDQLEDQIEAAEDAGDNARVAMLEKMLKLTEEDFEQAEEDYATKAEELRKKAQKTSSELADKSTNFFDKLATGGGAMGWFGELFGGVGLEGEAKTKLAVGEAKEDKEQMEAQLEKVKKMPKSKMKERMVKRLEAGIAKEGEKISGLESGETQKARITEIEKLIAEEQDKIKRSKDGEDVYGMSTENPFGRESEGQSESLETIEELQQELGPLKEEVSSMGEKKEGAATGAFVVNRPTYLPSSGVVVGESKGYSGGGLAKASDGPPELVATGAAEGMVQSGGGATQVYPLGGPQADELIKPVAKEMAGAAMNMLMVEKMMSSTSHMRQSAQPAIIDSSTINNVTNNTIIRTPSPSGPSLHFEGKDFVSKIA